MPERPKLRSNRLVVVVALAAALLVPAAAADQVGEQHGLAEHGLTEQGPEKHQVTQLGLLAEHLGDRVEPTAPAPPTSLSHTSLSNTSLSNTAVATGGSVNWSESATQASIGAGLAEAGDGAGSAILAFDFTLDGIDDLVIGTPGEDVGSISDAGVITLVPGDIRGFRTEPLTYDSVPVETYGQNGPVPGSAEANDRFGAALAAGDFNNDGFPELVVGAPGEGLGPLAGAGTITIIGINSFEPGLDPTASSAWSQDSPGVTGGAEADDRFGESLASGDFNGDGTMDLAVGAPGEDLGDLTDAGGVHILIGSSNWFDTANSQFISAATSGVSGAAEADDRFGQALAAGDFNLDGYTDLAVGIPGEDVGSIVDAGAVQIFYGGPDGLRTDNDLLLTESTPGVAGGAEAGDGFGSALAAGDFRGADDFPMDLVVGSPGEDIGSLADAGAIHVFYGDPSGLRTSDSRYLHQDSAGIDGGAEADDRFGASLAAGPVLSNAVLEPYDDLVIGVPGEDIGALVDAGALALLRGSAAGITTSNDRSIHAATAGVAGAAESGDALGQTVAVGDVSGNFQPAVLAGTPGEAVGSAVGAGGVLSLDARRPTADVTTDQPDDVVGKQIHVMYVLPSDATAGRNMDVGIRVDQNVVAAWFAQQMDGRELRWDTTSGILDITTVRLPVTAAEIGPDPDDVFRLQTQLQQLGFDNPDKLYLVYYEGEGDACGVTLPDSIAVIWMGSCGGSYPEFRVFPTASTYLFAHELAHGLGAVGGCAPNHAFNGHVDDDNTDLLYVDFAGQTQLFPDYQNLVVDFGNDDYYQHNTLGCADLDDTTYIESP